MHPKTRLVLPVIGLAGLLLLVLGWLVSTYTLSAVAANPPKGSGNSPLAAPGTKTINGNPFTVVVGTDGSFQIKNALDPISTTGGQFYPTGAFPGDAGFFLVTGSKVYGPDFANHAGSASNLYDLFTQVSQSAVTGDGSSGNPFTVTTVFDVPGTAIRVTQISQYRNGTQTLTESWSFSNNGNGGATPSFNFFFAGDIYFQGSDNGYGYYDTVSGAVGGFNQTNTGYELLVPVTAADKYFEGIYSDVWNRIGTAGAPGTGFNNTYITNRPPASTHDNGAGLQWNNRSVGGSVSANVVLGQGAIPSPTNPTPTPNPQQPPVPAKPDLTAQLRVDPDETAPADDQTVETYQIVAKNDGDGRASNVQLVFPLAAGQTLFSVAFTGTNTPWVTQVFTNSFTANLGNFDGHGSQVVTVTIRVSVKTGTAVGTNITTRVTLNAGWEGGPALPFISNSVSYSVGSSVQSDNSQDAIQSISASVNTTTKVVTVTGSIYIPNERLSAWINTPSGVKGIGAVVAQTDLNGNITYTYDVSGLPVGSYSIVLFGARSQVQGVASFTL